MSVLRCLLAVIAGASAITTAVLLDWPGWSIAPLVVLLVAASAYLVRAVRGRGYDLRPGRVDAAMTLIAAALAISTVTTAMVGVGDAVRSYGALRAAASATVRALFTFGPDDYTAAAAQRRQEALGPLLTGRLLADYRSQGPNVVLPSAVESGASVTTTVQAVGVGDSAPDVVRLLVFATEAITVATAVPPTSTVPIVRWAVMRRVENTWRLADIYPAGIGG